MTEKPQKKVGGKRPGAGRPHVCTQAAFDRILDKISKGIPLTVASADEGLGRQVVYNFRDVTQERRDAFQRARDLGADAIAEQCLALADQPPETYRQMGGGSRIDKGDVANRKLQIETRLKLLAKWNPKRYGDKLDVTSGGDTIKGNDPLTVIIEGAGAYTGAKDE